MTADAFIFRPAVSVSLDADAYTATIEGHVLRVGDSSDFQRAVWSVLRILHASPGRVFERHTLLEQAGMFAEDPRSVDTAIKRLRRVTRPLGVDLVRTVHGIGYAYDPRKL